MLEIWIENIRRQIKEIVCHTLLEHQPLYDLRNIIEQLEGLKENYMRFLQVEQEEIEWLSLFKLVITKYIVIYYVLRVRFDA